MHFLLKWPLKRRMPQVLGHPIEMKKLNQPLLEMHERRSQDERLHSGWNDMYSLWRKRTNITDHFAQRSSAMK